MIRSLIGLVIWVVRLGMIALVVYCVLSFVAPGGKVFAAAKKYVEPLVSPFRDLLYRFLPAAKGVRFDLGPVAAIVALEIVVLALRLLQAIL